MAAAACSGETDAASGNQGSGGNGSGGTESQGGAPSGSATTTTTSGAGGNNGTGGTGGSTSGSGGGMQTPPCVKDGSLPAPKTGVSEFSITQKIDGQDVQRRVILDVPATVDANKCYPLLFALHGNGGKPDGFVNRFKNQVGQGRFIGVYPEGHLSSWNLGKENSTADDVAFLEAAANELLQYGNVAHRRRYVAGWSNGAGMAHKLGIESDMFGAFAAIVTSLTTSNQPSIASRQPAVLQIMGADDKVIPYAGGQSPTGHVFEAAETSAQIWAQHNGCAKDPTSETTADGNLRIAYSNCNGDAEVIHYKIEGAGHNIPNNTEGGLNKLLWGFLAKH